MTSPFNNGGLPFGGFGELTSVCGESAALLHDTVIDQFWSAARPKIEVFTFKIAIKTPKITFFRACDGLSGVDYDLYLNN